VNVIGLSLPGICKPYIQAGVVQLIVLWNTRDLGYLAVYTAASLAQGKIQPGVASLSAGRLGNVQVRGSEVILGAPLIINKANVEQLSF
jgi:rhamnose transport system permease protein